MKWPSTSSNLLRQQSSYHWRAFKLLPITAHNYSVNHGFHKVATLLLAFALGTSAAASFITKNNGQKIDTNRGSGHLYISSETAEKYLRYTPGYSRRIFSSISIRPTVALCEAKTPNNNDKEDDNIVRDLSSKDTYQRINPPLRMLEDTHAVGQMLKPNMIEQYEIYKKLDTSASSFQHPDASVNIVTALLKFGKSLDGHPGVVHGGILALALDDVFGFSYHAIGIPMAVTANLNLNYRAAVPAGSQVLIQVHLDRRENRKLYFTAEITSLDGKTVYTEATCLYIIPRSVWETMRKEKAESL